MLFMVEEVTVFLEDCVEKNRLISDPEKKVLNPTRSRKKTSQKVFLHGTFGGDG